MSDKFNINDLFGNEPPKMTNEDHDHIKSVSINVIPNKCQTCIVSAVCNPLSYYISLLEIGIQLQVDSCPYMKDINELSDTTE